jgi:HlyD family secretion protein
VLTPDNQPLEIALQVDPIHIDEVAAGQPVTLRFTSFNARTTPEIPATVSRVAPDALADPQTGLTWFEVIVAPDEATLSGAGLALRPGLPVEAFIEAAPRSPLSWMIRPFTDQLNRAMREE